MLAFGAPSYLSVKFIYPNGVTLADAVLDDVQISFAAVGSLIGFNQWSTGYRVVDFEMDGKDSCIITVNPEKLSPSDSLSISIQLED